MTGLLILKELIDVFAKSRLEYIRPPEIEFLVDILFGLLGIGCAVLLIFLKKKKTKIL